MFFFRKTNYVWKKLYGRRVPPSWQMSKIVFLFLLLLRKNAFFWKWGGGCPIFLVLGKLTGVNGNDCWEFGNKNRNSKGMEKIIPKLREWEGNEKIPFPKFGNGKGMKKIHSQNSGTGREWKNPFPKFGKGNQRPPFLGMTGNGNGNGNNILFTFLDFFFLGLPWKFLPQNLFLTPPHV